MASDSRDSERVDFVGALHGEVMVFQPSAIRQISHGGMQVETSFPLQLDSLHDFRITLGERSVVVKGRIAHSRISDVDQDIVTYRTGVEFIELSDRVAAAIQDFVDEIAREKSRLPD
jgi:c-di-GMP-binding flagellar brake protein YcgR